MAAYTVVYAPEAEAQLVSLYRYIARHASRERAKRYTDAIVLRCESLEHMPRQGTPRDDVRPGVRTLSFRRRVLIAYDVGGRTVTVLGIFYGGQDWEALLREG